MATVAEPITQVHVWHTETRANFVEKSDTGRNFAENAKEQMVNKVVTPNRMANNIGMPAKTAVGETEDSMIWSQQPVTLQRKTPLTPMIAYAYPMIAYAYPVYEVFTTLDAIGPRKKGIRKIQLQVDTGAAGITLPLRTYK